MSRIKVWSSGSNPTNASSSFRLSTSTRSTKRQAWRHTVRGDYTGQNVFKVPNRLCFTRPNSFPDCHSTDLPLTQRKWPLSTTLKWPGGGWGGGGGGGWHESTENTTDNCWLNVCQDMGGRKTCPWHLKRFWIEHNLFWQLVLYHWLFWRHTWCPLVTMTRCGQVSCAVHMLSLST